MYYNICPHCGAHLDPGEPCDCREKKKEYTQKYSELLTTDKSGQMALKEVGAV